ncbi:antA/AntB antirepressor family protein [Neisseria zoodegmatis]|uniref:Phage anti-repressor protein n=1 Tax=Neisseria zoodegmatis TaxID=326523 RepID=A0AB38DSL0_9NEIS|nr:antA/AntB antirepressor family protein [Neisseria zoodegmatis]SNU80195.1 phage anti-repressor protein [Neisseria zoodegmatis]
MNNQNLIPVFSGKISRSEALLCDARKLHEFLQVSSRFNDWIKKRIEEYGFQENQDFISFTENSVKPQGGRKSTEYHITLDMAKELAMVERNEQGRAARRYFIECEKKLAEAQRLSEKKQLPAKIKRRIRNRDDLSFTRRDVQGRFINWHPPTDENGIYWQDAYMIGQAWFDEVRELAKNNPEEAFYVLTHATRLMAVHTALYDGGNGFGYVEGFFSKMARYTLTAVLSHQEEIAFPFASDLGSAVDLAVYLKQAAPLSDDELRWQAWTESEACRRRCFEMKLAELSGLHS